MSAQAAVSSATAAKKGARVRSSDRERPLHQLVGASGIEPPTTTMSKWGLNPRNYLIWQ